MRQTIIQVCGNRGMAGMERHVALISRDLRDRGLDVKVACKAGGWLADELRNDVEVFPVPLMRHLDLSSARRLSEVFAQVRPDVIHAHGPIAYRYTARADRGSARLVTTVHGMGGWSRTLAQADRIIAVSNWTKRQTAGLVDPERVQVVLNGVDCRRFADYADAAPTFRDELGLGNRPIIACVARLVPIKGQHLILQAARKVLAAFPEAAFVIVGGRSRSYEKRLKSMVKALGLGKSVIFAGVRTDIPRVLASTTVYVQPSLVDPHPVTVLEALAAGVPLIGADVGGISETLVDGETGYLFDVEKPEELSDKIIACLSDADLAARLAAAGQRDALKRFAQERVVDDLVRIYSEAAADAVGAAR